MATTTNYGWTTPDDTSLVKDGASAIRTLGSSVDTTVKNLNPGTTSGDIDYYTSSTAKARLAKGTAGQVLAMNSGATAPEWTTISSGGLTLLSTTTLSGATTTISSISGSYTHLYLSIYGVTNATNDGDFRIAPNGTTNITTGLYTGGTQWADRMANYLFLNSVNSIQSARTNANNAWSVFISNYANTSYFKTYEMYGSHFWTANGTQIGTWSAGAINTNSAITSLVFSNSGGNLSTGTVLLYGVK